MRALFNKCAVLAALGVLTMGAALAQDASPLPPVQKSGGVEYLNGGIGLDQSTAMRQMSKRWPLTLEFAVKDQHGADFAANVQATIRDTNGQSVIQVDSAGPLLMAKLPPGQYTVDATFAGKTLHRRVAVKPGQPATEAFLWPEGTDQPLS